MNAEVQKAPGNILANLNGLLPDLESVYKGIRSHPQLSMQENRTAGSMEALVVAAHAWLLV